MNSLSDNMGCLSDRLGRANTTTVTSTSGGALDLAPLLGAVKQQLQSFAGSEDAIAHLTTVFEGSSQESLQEMLENWSSQDFEQLPNLVVVADEAMNGAQGAFASEKNTIYLAESLVSQASSQWSDPLSGAVGVVIEEIGHSLDALLYLNGYDTEGDEGESFKALVLGMELSQPEQLRIQSENDHGIIHVDGEAIAVEYAKVEGNDGDNTLNGTATDDSIFGYGGNDKLRGKQGNDQLDGGDGNDLLNGGQDNDRLSGEAGRDKLNGHQGADHLDGGTGDDKLAGGKGNDVLDGGAGSDKLYGQDGDDRLNGYGYGAKERDRLNGGDGADTFVLGDDTEAFYTQSGDKDYVTIADLDVDQDRIDLPKLNDTVVSDTEAFGYTLGKTRKGYVEVLGEGGDRIAVLRGIKDISLTDSVFGFQPHEWSNELDSFDLQASVNGTDLEAIANSIEAGTAIAVHPVLSDYPLIQMADLLVNGVVIQSTNQEPFSFETLVPQSLATPETMTIQMRLTDTDGNQSLSETIAIPITPDATPPQLVKIIVPEKPTDEKAIVFEFSEAVLFSALNPDPVRILDKKGDPVSPPILSQEKDGQRLKASFETLPLGSYTIEIDAANIQDALGNSLGTETITQAFDIEGEKQLTVIDLTDPSVMAETLAQTIVGDDIAITNVEWLGDDRTLGLFENGNAVDLDIESGVILSTGLAVDASTGAKTGDAFSFHSDLTFDFFPRKNTMQFQVIFASDEYPEFKKYDVQELDWSPLDAFGLSIYRYETANDSRKDFDTVRSIGIDLNSGTPGFFRPDDFQSNTIDGFNSNSLNEVTTPESFNLNYGASKVTGLGFDGFTDALTVTVDVIAGQKYGLSLGIVDGTGNLEGESAVFITAGSGSCSYHNTMTESELLSAVWCNTRQLAISQGNDDLAAEVEKYEDLIESVGEVVNEQRLHDVFKPLLGDLFGDILTIASDADLDQVVNELYTAVTQDSYSLKEILFPLEVLSIAALNSTTQSLISDSEFAQALIELSSTYAALNPLAHNDEASDLFLNSLWNDEGTKDRSRWEKGSTELQEFLTDPITDSTTVQVDDAIALIQFSTRLLKTAFAITEAPLDADEVATSGSGLTLDEIRTPDFPEALLKLGKAYAALNPHSSNHDVAGAVDSDLFLSYLWTAADQNSIDKGGNLLEATFAELKSIDEKVEALKFETELIKLIQTFPKKLESYQKDSIFVNGLIKNAELYFTLKSQEHPNTNISLKNGEISTTDFINTAFSLEEQEFLRWLQDVNEERTEYEDYITIEQVNAGQVFLNYSLLSSFPGEERVVNSGHETEFIFFNRQGDEYQAASIQIRREDGTEEIYLGDQTFKLYAERGSVDGLESDEVPLYPGDIVQRDVQLLKPVESLSAFQKIQESFRLVDRVLWEEGEELVEAIIKHKWIMLPLLGAFMGLQFTPAGPVLDAVFLLTAGFQSAFSLTSYLIEASQAETQEELWGATEHLADFFIALVDFATSPSPASIQNKLVDFARAFSASDLLTTLRHIQDEGIDLGTGLHAAIIAGLGRFDDATGALGQTLRIGKNQVATFLTNRAVKAFQEADDVTALEQIKSFLIAFDDGWKITQDVANQLDELPDIKAAISQHPGALAPILEGGHSFLQREWPALQGTGLENFDIAYLLELFDDVPLFRGTTDGFPGNDVLQRLGISPASVDPLVSTIFALEGKAKTGDAVVLIAFRQNLDYPIIDLGNVRRSLEREVQVELLPIEFQNNATLSISVDKARQILSDMGIVDLPSSISSGDSTQLLENTPRLTPEQIYNFVQRAR